MDYKSIVSPRHPALHILVAPSLIAVDYSRSLVRCSRISEATGAILLDGRADNHKVDMEQAYGT